MRAREQEPMKEKGEAEMDAPGRAESLPSVVILDRVLGLGLRLEM